MSKFYELIKNNKGFPIKTFVHSVDSFQMHWHKELEILLVLKGSVNITIRDKAYLLKENDLIVINSMEMHNINKSKEDNVILALQINLNYYNEFYPKITNVVFDCNSSISTKHEKFDVIRNLLAEIVWERNKKKEEYELIIGSKINLLTNF